ncbi:MAG TPA: hypothetical protein VGC66_20470 [Pyrinomonadaceae bacterium]|jgi:hypothetical protein
MSKENWITIGIAVTTNIISIVALVIGWKMSRRQIQIMLEQARPAAKAKKAKPRKTEIAWFSYIPIGASILGLLSALAMVVLCFTFAPNSPRLALAFTLIYGFMAYFHFTYLRYELRKLRKLRVEAL